MSGISPDAATSRRSAHASAMSLNTIKVPTLEQLGEVAAELGFTLPRGRSRRASSKPAPAFEAYNRLDRMPDELPPVTYPRLPGRRPSARGEPVRRLVRQDRNRGRRVRQAQRQEDRAEGQCLPRRRADDERRLDDGRLCAGCRRDRRDAHPRRRRHDHRQDGVRVFLLLGRQPHQRHRPGAQPAPHGLFGRRLVLRQCRRRRCGRGADGIGRRPGRLDPHPGLVLRHLRHEADAWARALHRHHADRADIGPHRPDDRDGRGQCAAAGGVGRAGRARPAAIRRRGKALSRGIGQRCRRAEDRASSRRALAIRNRCRKSMRSSAKRRSGSREWAPRSTRCRSRCTATVRRSGWRLPPRAPRCR